MVNAQVHRYRDSVAVYLGKGQTVYLTPKEARQFARAINKTAKSCQSETFAQSTCGTTEFAFEGIAK